MPVQLELLGERFGRLTVIEGPGFNNHGKTVWRCLCDCGNLTITVGSRLNNGATRSCGCLQREAVQKTGKKNVRHGFSTAGVIRPTYYLWQAMLQRCVNPNHVAYGRYGGRGIAVCKRWYKFENFLADMGQRPANDLTLERINNNKNYCKSNCKWATMKEQANNRSKNRKFSLTLPISKNTISENNRSSDMARPTHGYVFRKQKKSLGEWAEEFKIPYQTLYARVVRFGWDMKRALTTPVRTKRSNRF